MKKYLVSMCPDYWEDDSEQYRIVIASNKKEASQKFIAWFIANNKEFREHIRGDFTNEFAYINGRFFMEDGELIADEETLEAAFNNNVREYFKDKPEYADIYLDALLCREEEYMELPEEMIVYIGNREMSNWYGVDELLVIDIDTITIGGDV